MTQEEKNLLLKDLCARLPYGCFYKASKKITHWNRSSLSLKTIDKLLQDYYDDIKPYLRPMSSMTEEEKQCKEEYFKYDYCSWDYTDWLNSHHFDYRRLIEKGLALEAPKGMYKIE